MADLGQVVLQGLINQKAPRALSEGVYADVKINKRGELCVINFYQQCALEGRVFQVRAGAESSTETGQVVLTDQGSELAAGCATGLLMLPVRVHLGISDVEAGTLHEYAAKSVGTLFTPGTAFVPLPLKLGGPASRCIAEVDDEGGVGVAVELNTTTRTHWHAANPLAEGAGHAEATYTWEPNCPPPLAGPATFYVQVASTGTAVEYMAFFDFIELPTVNVS